MIAADGRAGGRWNGSGRGRAEQGSNGRRRLRGARNARDIVTEAVRGDAHHRVVKLLLALGAQAVEVEAVLAPLPVLEVGAPAHALGVVEVFKRRAGVGRAEDLDGHDFDARGDGGRVGGAARGDIRRAYFGGVVTWDEVLVVIPLGDGRCETACGQSRETQKGLSDERHFEIVLSRILE